MSAMGKNIKEILHAKRVLTEEHIRQLEKTGKQGTRYTATISDGKFLVFGLLCDIGWMLHLAAEITYCAKNGLAYAADGLALLALACTMVGVGFTVYLNRIHEKEIATRFQKNMSFGLTVCGGLAGAIIAIFQMALYAGISKALLLVAAGGFLNFAAGLPIFLSFKKGIRYGIH